MAHEPTSTARARRLRERRARGVVMVAPVEVGGGFGKITKGGSLSDGLGWFGVIRFDHLSHK